MPQYGKEQQPDFCCGEDRSADRAGPKNQCCGNADCRHGRQQEKCEKRAVADGHHGSRVPGFGLLDISLDADNDDLIENINL